MNPVVLTAIARATDSSPEEILDYVALCEGEKGPPLTLVELYDMMTWPECANQGCTQPRSNYNDECFECNYAPYGTAWQEEMMQR